MAISHEDIMEIKKVLDARYVLQSDCNERQERINGKFANDDKRIDLIIQNQAHQDKKMNVNNWLTTAILGVIISLALGFFFGG